MRWAGSLLGHRVKEGKRVGWLSAQKQRREEKTIFLNIFCFQKKSFAMF
jgi:hypothetical protein